MTTTVRMRELEEEIAFIKAAADRFEKNPVLATFTTGAIQPGCLFAVRWGLTDRAILVFRLDENTEPHIYMDQLKDE